MTLAVDTVLSRLSGDELSEIHIRLAEFGVFFGEPAVKLAVVRVPLFVQNGEVIKVDTRTGEYVSRVKE